MKTIYELALEDLDEEETVPTDARNILEEFIKKNNLGSGFDKKSLDLFYYWYYTTAADNAVSLQEFRKAFPKSPFVSFSYGKLSITKEEFRRIEFEYEKEKLRKKSRKKPRGKTRFI